MTHPITTPLLLGVRVPSPPPHAATTKVHQNDPPLSPRSQHKIGLLSLAALIFFSVSGGPFGMEEALLTAGPLVTMLGLCLLPLLWSCPEALVTAELAPAFPEASGSVAWVEAAFGPFAGWLKGYLSWLSGVTDNALYPVLIVDYVLGFFSDEVEKAGFVEDSFHRVALLVGLTVLLTYLNWRGLDVVGNAAIGLTVISMLPFLILIIVAAYKYQTLDFSRLGKLPEGGFKGVQWSSFLNVLFWQLNYFDSVSTFAADVKNPGYTFPRALALAVVLVVLSTALPLVVAVVGTEFPYSDYTDGFFSVIGEAMVGRWLGAFIAFAAALSSVGMYEAEMSSDAFMLMGLSEHGHLPAVFAHRSRHGTPTLAIVCSALGIVGLSLMSFLQIVEVLNLLYVLAMLLEFSAFIRLRMIRPDLPRPFRIPLSTKGVCLMLAGPVLLLFVMLALAPFTTWCICGVAVVVGCGLYWVLHHPKTRRCCKFYRDPYSPQPAVVGDPYVPAVLLYGTAAGTTESRTYRGMVGLDHDKGEESKERVYREDWVDDGGGSNGMVGV